MLIVLRFPSVTFVGYDVREGWCAVNERKRWQPSGFAERLRQVREAKGLTQTQLAEAAGCFPMTISKLERGAQEPAWPLVLALARALGVSCQAFQVDDGTTDAISSAAGTPEAVEAPLPRGSHRRAASAESELKRNQRRKRKGK